MKRIALFALLLSLALAGAVRVYADESHGSTRLSVDPSTMKEGETKTLVDGDKTIAITRRGDAVDIRIDGAGRTRTITVNNEGGAISISRDGMAFRTMPEMRMPRILIDGKELGGLPRDFERRPEKAQTWFVCPKDHTVLRVPEEKADRGFQCPLDGTQMEKRKGRGLALFFDREEHL